MQINFHRLLWSYLPRVPIFLAMTVHKVPMFCKRDFRSLLIFLFFCSANQCHSPLSTLPLQMDIAPGPDGRFGFTIVGDSPLLVENCVLNSPAGRSGLRAGDYVMEVNGIPVKHHETAAAMIKSSQGRTLRLGVLRINRWQKRTSSSMKETSQSGDMVRQDRKHKALEFNKKVSLKGHGKTDSHFSLATNSH